MAPRNERRSRMVSGGRMQGSSTDTSLLDAPAPLSPCENTEPHRHEEGEEVKSSTPGISILKEIFPDHGVDTGKQAPVAQLPSIIGSVPSPARAHFATCPPQHSPGGVPFGPPAYSLMPTVAPVFPPPPPVLPAPACQEPWEPHRATGPLLQEPTFTNYRERLRAGGRGALQRAIDAGFVPKNMKQDWGAVHMSSAHHSAAMSTQQWDGHHMWNGSGHMQHDYCGVPMQSQYSHECYQMQAPQPAMPMHQQQMQMPTCPTMLPQMAVQQPMQPQMQMMPMGQGDQSPMQMQVPQMSVPQMQLPQMPMPQVATPTASGESTPTGIESVQRECLAILMPQASQFPCDKDMLAAQLKASADCQRYED